LRGPLKPILFAKTNTKEKTGVTPFLKKEKLPGGWSGKNRGEKRASCKRETHQGVPFFQKTKRKKKGKSPNHGGPGRTKRGRVLLRKKKKKGGGGSNLFRGGGWTDLGGGAYLRGKVKVTDRGKNRKNRLGEKRNVTPGKAYWGLKRREGVFTIYQKEGGKNSRPPLPQKKNFRKRKNFVPARRTGLLTGEGKKRIQKPERKDFNIRGGGEGGCFS